MTAPSHCIGIGQKGRVATHASAPPATCTTLQNSTLHHHALSCTVGKTPLQLPSTAPSSPQAAARQAPRISRHILHVAGGGLHQANACAQPLPQKKMYLATPLLALEAHHASAHATQHNTTHTRTQRTQAPAAAPLLETHSRAPGRAARLQDHHTTAHSTSHQQHQQSPRQHQLDTHVRTA